VGSLEFEPPDEGTFRCLRLAREAGVTGGTAPCVLNAADEVAVEAFLAGRVPFTAIAELVEHALSSLPAQEPGHFEDLILADAQARELTRERIAELAGAAR
jgi:1-deoxy-D-xylulose-5-phosphate reductoisomerase